MIQPNVIDRYSVFVPGSASGARSAIARVIASQSHIISGVTPSGICGTQARCVSASRTVVFALPRAPYSGQYFAMGAS